MLRNNATEEEQILWEKLKGRQMLGCKFRRQYGIGPFIVDFYWPELELAIEIDGSSHTTAVSLENDALRQASIEGHGINMIRFTNKDVRDNLNHVLLVIAQKVRERQK